MSQSPDRIATDKFSALHQLWERLEPSVRKILNLLVPQVVHVEISPERQLSDAIARSIHDRDFRNQLLADPLSTLSEIGIILPSQPQIIVIESTADRTFLVLPLQTEIEIADVRAGLSSRRSQRAIRSQIILKVWQDPAYKVRLAADPHAVLHAAGVRLPDTTTVTILENTADRLYLVLPAH